MKWNKLADIDCDRQIVVNLYVFLMSIMWTEDNLSSRCEVCTPYSTRRLLKKKLYLTNIMNKLVRHVNA